VLGNETQRFSMLFQLNEGVLSPSYKAMRKTPATTETSIASFSEMSTNNALQESLKRIVGVAAAQRLRKTPTTA